MTRNLLILLAILGTSCRAGRAPVPARTCLVLSVGGPKGLAHLGALEALQEAGIRPDCVYGNSMGALVGALWVDAPGEKPADRYRALMARYTKATQVEAGARAVVASLVAATLLVLTSGTVGWETLGAAVAGGAAGAATATPRDWERFSKTLEEHFAGRQIETLSPPFATGWLRRNASGFDPEIARQGGLADAVGASIRNPLVFEDLDIAKLDRLDPGIDRVAAVPLEDACNTFGPARLIAVNVSGLPSFRSASLACPVTEIVIETGVVDPLALAGSGPEFDRLWKLGHDAMAAAVLLR